MIEKPASPLSGSSDNVLVGHIPTAPLTELYAKNGFDIRGDVQGVKDIEVWQCSISGLKFTVPCITGSPDFYAQVEKKGSEYSTEKFEFELLAATIQPGQSVLDVGCGFGNLAAHIPSAKYTGLEFSHHAVERGREKGRNILRESVQDHALNAAGQYDVVVSFQVLEHVADPKGFLAACAACLKPGGMIVIGVPADDSFLGATVNDIFCLPPHHVTFWPDRALRFALHQAGLEQVQIEHEPLAPVHIPFYAHQLMLRALATGEPDYVRTDLRFRLRNKLAFWLGKLVQRAFRHGPRYLAAGHSIVGTARKPGG